MNAYPPNVTMLSPTRIQDGNQLHSQSLGNSVGPTLTSHGIPTFDAIAQVVTVSNSSKSVTSLQDVALAHGPVQGNDVRYDFATLSHNMTASPGSSSSVSSSTGSIPSLHLPPQANHPLGSSESESSLPRIRRLSQERAGNESIIGTSVFQPVIPISSQARSYATCVKSALSLAFVLAFLELGSAIFLLTRQSRATTFLAACTIALALASGGLALVGNLGLSVYISASRIPQYILKSTSWSSHRSSFSSNGSYTTTSTASPQQHETSSTTSQNSRIAKFERRHADYAIQSSSLLTFFLSAGSHLVAIKTIFAIAVLVLSESHPGYLVRDWFGADPASAYHHSQRAFSGSAPASRAMPSGANEEKSASWLSLSFARSDLNYVAARAAAEGLDGSHDDMHTSDTLSALEATASAATLLAGSISLASCVALITCLVLIRMKVPFPVDSLQVFLTNALFLGLSGLTLVATTARLRAAPNELAALGHSLDSDVTFSYTLGLLTLVVVGLALRRASGWYYIESRRADVTVSDAKSRNSTVSASLFPSGQERMPSGQTFDTTSSQPNTAGPNATGAPLQDDIAEAAAAYNAIMREFDEMGAELGTKPQKNRVVAVADALSTGDATNRSGLTSWITQLDADKIGSALAPSKQAMASVWDWLVTLGRGRIHTSRKQNTHSRIETTFQTSQSQTVEAICHKLTASVLFFLSFLCLSFILGRMIDLVDVLPYAMTAESKPLSSSPLSTPSYSFSDGYPGNAHFATGSMGGSIDTDVEGDADGEWRDGTPEVDLSADSDHETGTMLHRSFAPTRNVRTFSLLSLSEIEANTEPAHEPHASSSTSSSPYYDHQDESEEALGQDADQYRVFLLLLLASLIVLCLFSAFGTFLAFKASEWVTTPTLNHRSVGWFKRNWRSKV